jgi:hypothetical protein
MPASGPASVPVHVVHWREGTATSWKWFQMQCHREELAREWIRDLIRQGHFAYLTSHPTPLPDQFFVATRRGSGGIYIRSERT